ncbi:hypothetical protein [Clostridium baratii]|uniref:hypothetical protein n=1 Tax=Clostridium baratii TaxID=1561 RepID=UPI0030D48258
MKIVFTMGAIVEFFDNSDYSNLEIDCKGYVVDTDSNNIVGKLKDHVIALGFTRAGLGVDYKGNSINDDIPFADIGLLRRTLK